MLTLVRYSSVVRWITLSYVSGLYPNSDALSVAAECAGRQGRYDDFLTAAYDDRESWLRSSDADAISAAERFAAIPKVAHPLALLAELGLGYLELGQASNTLSGGEAQRLKLVSELSGAGRRRTLYVMDEPTTGLHRDDVARLLGVLTRLVERGDTVLVIEHHPDVMVAADWILDLGPEGGDKGGRIVAQGTPEDILAVRKSYTGQFLAPHMPDRPQKKKRA